MILKSNNRKQIYPNYSNPNSETLSKTLSTSDLIANIHVDKNITYLQTIRPFRAWIREN